MKTNEQNAPIVLDENAIEKLANEQFVQLVHRDDEGEVNHTRTGTINLDSMSFRETENERDWPLSKWLSADSTVSIEPHPAAKWLNASSISIEADCAEMQVYPTESGLANISRTVGYCNGLFHCRDQQLIRYAEWVLAGLHRNIEFLGCSRNRLHYDAAGNDLHKKYPYDFDATEEQQYERLAKIESETVTTAPAIKKILWGEDQFSFCWLMHRAIPHAEYRSAIQQYEEKNPTMDWHILEENVNKQLKLAEYSGFSKMLRYERLTERNYAYAFTTHYSRGMNGGLIQRFLTDDYEKMKPDSRFLSYSCHS